MTRDQWTKLWGIFTTVFGFAYITCGGGHELYAVYTTHHVHTSFLFISLSALIFIGRIGHAISSGAKETVAMDIYGAIVMTALSVTRLCLDGF